MALKRPDIIICNDINDISAKAATTFLEIANSSILKKGVFRVALSGGSTPRQLYSLLSTDKFRLRCDWSNIHFFWGDERCVPPDDMRSNYRTVFDILLRKLALPDENIHRIKGERGEVAAVEYEKEIKRVFKIKGRSFPEFDLILLGMGEDGHTASIFPYTHAVRGDNKIVTALSPDKLKVPRITLTPPVINNARNIIFLVSGSKKASVLKEVIEGDFEPERFPAQTTRLSKGKVRWFVDTGAAERLAQSVYTA
jgi:6-phosphogluconolactonase